MYQLNFKIESFGDWLKAIATLITVLTVTLSPVYYSMNKMLFKVNWAYNSSVHDESVEILKQFEKFNKDPDSLRETDLNALMTRCSNLRLISIQKSYVIPEAQLYIFNSALKKCENIDLIKRGG